MKLAYLLLLVSFGYACSDDSSNVNPEETTDMGSDLATATDLPVDRDLGSPDAGDDTGTTEPLPKGWSAIAPLAAGPRQETAVVALDDAIWVLGGFDGRLQMVATVESFDPTSGEWSAHSPLPVPMHHANAAVVDGRIYVVGFLVGGFAADGRVFAYSPDTDTWSPAGQFPTARRRGASAVGTIDGKIYLAGGLRNGAVDEVDVYDPSDESFTPLTVLPRTMDHGAFGVISGKLVVAGGRNGSIDAHDPSVDIYDPESNTWTSGSPMPTSRGGVASAVQNGQLFVFGGEGNPDKTSGVYDTVESYDFGSNTWTSLPPMPVPRHGMGAAALNGIIYVPGGANIEAFAPVDHSDVYVPED